MDQILKIYIPSSCLRDRVRSVLSILNFPVLLLDQLPKQGSEFIEDILTISSDVPMRLGAILDWIELRASLFQKGALSLPDPILCASGAFFVKKQTFVSVKGDRIRLTERESDLLCALYRADGHCMGKADLLNLVWGYAVGVETHTIETHLYRLRQKIERDAAVPENILTTDRGYQLVLADTVT